MISKKIECENGWIVFVVKGHGVIEVHSTGELSSGNDDRSTGIDLIKILCNDAMNNNLHTQAPGRCGVQWPFKL